MGHKIHPLFFRFGKQFMSKPSNSRCILFLIWFSFNSLQNLFSVKQEQDLIYRFEIFSFSSKIIINRIHLCQTSTIFYIFIEFLPSVFSPSTYMLALEKFFMFCQQQLVFHKIVPKCFSMDSLLKDNNVFFSTISNFQLPSFVLNTFDYYNIAALFSFRISSLIGNFIKQFFELFNVKQIRGVLQSFIELIRVRQQLNFLCKYNFKGCFIQFKGRLFGSERSTITSYKIGSLTKQTLFMPLDFKLVPFYTVYGKVSLKIWVSY
jgi:hypothetical protein